MYEVNVQPKVLHLEAQRKTDVTDSKPGTKASENEGERKEWVERGKGE